MNNARKPKIIPRTNKNSPENPVLVPGRTEAMIGKAKNKKIRAKRIAKKNCFHFLFKQST